MGEWKNKPIKRKWEEGRSDF